MDQIKSGRGIVICGGGYTYFTNAWIAIKLMRSSGVTLPIELWILPKEEFPGMRELLFDEGVSLHLCDAKSSAKALPHGARWQWVMKPWSILASKYREIIFLDADNFPTRNPEFLFDCPQYKETGAIFWPDIGVTSQDNPIWADVGIPFRYEPEFETGQMVLDSVRHREPLEMALDMNIEADKYYHMIWGDKDTFRFAFHKFGRPYSIVPHPPQLLAIPGGQNGDFGVMCQHDFSGSRIFQHRNLVKWDLLGTNPRIPGYLFDNESREYLADLRSRWNGLIPDEKTNGTFPPNLKAERNAVIQNLTKGVWLAEDHRPRQKACCGPLQSWSEQRISKPWTKEEKEDVVVLAKQDGIPVLLDSNSDETAAKEQRLLLRYVELAFDEDGTLKKGASAQAYWWKIKGADDLWHLELLNARGVVAQLLLTQSGEWSGHWTKSSPPEKLILRRLELLYPHANSDVSFLELPDPSYVEHPPEDVQQQGKRTLLHLANHAYGIGDAITGLYTAVGAAAAGYEVVYHTRYPQWMLRASYPNLSITDEPPPSGTADMDADHAEQLRYASDKVKWYCGQASGNQHPWTGQRPKVDIKLRSKRVDFPRYVVISPFASWESRDWPEIHWRRLAYLLHERGLEIIVIGTKKEEEKIARTFLKSFAYWIIRRDDNWPEWVTDLLLGSEGLFGLDSGMVHMAGLLGVPAIAIHSHLPSNFLFGCVQSVMSVCPTTNCTFCRWQEDRGHNEVCENSCSALSTIGPEQVLSEFDSVPMRLIRSNWIKQRDAAALNLADATKIAIVDQTFARLKDDHFDIIAYTYGPDTGLGQAAAMNIRAMREAGYSVEQRSWNGWLAEESALRDPQQIYYHHWHPQHHERDRYWPVAGFSPRKEGACHVAYWVYELENKLPEEYKNASRNFNEIWTASEFCRKIFMDCHCPVYLLPHAVNSCNKESILSRHSGPQPGEFIVLFVFDAWSRLARKNPQAVIRVFRQAFAGNNHVKLILKTHHLKPDEYNSLNHIIGGDKRIVLINNFLAASELEALYTSANVFLGLQRSEGFGLNLAHALSTGLPLLTTGYGGHLDFVNEHNAWLVPFRLVDAEKESDMFYTTGSWSEPDEDEAIRTLQEIAALTLRGDPILLEKALNGHSSLSRGFSKQVLQHRVRQLIDRLMNKNQDLLAPQQGINSDGIFSPP